MSCCLCPVHSGQEVHLGLEVLVLDVGKVDGIGFEALDPPRLGDGVDECRSKLGRVEDTHVEASVVHGVRSPVAVLPILVPDLEDALHHALPQHQVDRPLVDLLYLLDGGHKALQELH